MATVLTPVLAAALAALQVGVAEPPDTTGAYLDARAAELVALARVARETQDASLTAYRASARERATALLRTPGRDRLLYRREMAANLDWTRDGAATVTLLGAREYVPLPGVGVRALPGAEREALDVAFTPRDFTTFIGIGNFRFGAHPLNPGSEADYRFASGPRSMLTLQDGRSIVTEEVIVLPRRPDSGLVSGTIHLEEGSGRVVQEAYRKAAPIDAASVPLVGRISVEPREIVIDHTLQELRWWLPHSILIDGIVRAGRIAAVPFRYERTYDDYELEGVPAADPLVALAEAAVADRLRADSLRVDTLAADTLRADTLAADTAVADPRAVVVPGTGNEQPRPQSSQRWRVVLPADRTQLVESAHLPASIFDEDAAPIGGEAALPMRTRLDAIAPPQLVFGGGRAFVELAPLDQVRYNRVEGLSFTVRGGVDMGGVRPFADARIATAGRVLRGAAGVEATTTLGELGFATYDRVQAHDPASRPFHAANSLSTFLFGDDYGQYHAARGAELVRASPSHARTPWTLRFYAEQQDSVRVRPLFTLRRMFGGVGWLRAGLPAEPATQYGATLDVALGGGLGPEQAQWRVVPRLHGSFGDFGYGQASLLASLSAPLPVSGPWGGGITAAIEVAGGASAGTIPGQALWYLGGAPTVRGYPPASTAGEHFWRARTEVGTSAPASRVTVFGDVGRAYGIGHLFEAQPTLLAAGAGVSFMEGLVRVDLARAMRFRRGWRLQVAFDNVM